MADMYTRVTVVGRVSVVKTGKRDNGQEYRSVTITTAGSEPYIGWPEKLAVPVEGDFVEVTGELTNMKGSIGIRPTACKVLAKGQ